MDQYWIYEHWKPSTCSNQKKVPKNWFMALNYNAVTLRLETIITVMCVLQVLSLICSSLACQKSLSFGLCRLCLIASLIGSLPQGQLYIK